MEQAERLTVAVLMGGSSSEREISIESGKNVARFLDDSKYAAIPVEILTGGAWIGWDLSYASTYPVSLKPGALKIAGKSADVVFVALHGKMGEDGTVQGLLEVLGVPYTGSGVLASALAMNKAFSKKIFLQENIPTSRFVQVDRAAWRQGAEDQRDVVETITRKLGAPVVRRPGRHHRRRAVVR